MLQRVVYTHVPTRVDVYVCICIYMCVAVYSYVWRVHGDACMSVFLGGVACAKRGRERGEGRRGTEVFCGVCTGSACVDA